MEYRPSKTVSRFMNSTAKVKCIVGPFGSGKTMGALFELFRRMVEQEPDDDGVRHTRMALVRNTASQLRETLLVDADKYFGKFFTHKVSTASLEFDFAMRDNTRVRSTWLLVPLDRTEDQKKLLSLNLTGALLDECREIPYSIVEAVEGRVGRFPPKMMAPRTWRGVLLVSNPWSVASEYHEYFVINRPENWGLFKQPGGLDPDAENTEWLDDNYYEELAVGKSEQWVNVHVHGKWGDDLGGQAVYKTTWDSELHAVRDMKGNPNIPLLLGIDFGRNPAVVVTQEDYSGRLCVLEEMTIDDAGLHVFMEQVVMPTLRERYGNYRIFVVGDPAGKQRSPYDDSSGFKVLSDYGLEAIPAQTNDPEARIEAVEKRLIQRTSYGPGMMIDPVMCPRLYEGFERGYRFKRTQAGVLINSPEKNKFSHPHDALQYAVLGHMNRFIGKYVASKSRPRVVNVPRISPKAWT